MEPSIVERTKEDKEPVHEVLPGIKNFGFSDASISIGSTIFVDKKICTVRVYDKEARKMTVQHEGTEIEYSGDDLDRVKLKIGVYL